MGVTLIDACGPCEKPMVYSVDLQQDIGRWSDTFCLRRVPLHISDRFKGLLPFLEAQGLALPNLLQYLEL